MCLRFGQTTEALCDLVAHVFRLCFLRGAASAAFAPLPLTGLAFLSKAKACVSRAMQALVLPRARFVLFLFVLRLLLSLFWS